MNETALPPAPVQPEPWPRRFLLVFYAPSRLFASLRQGPDAWWAPLLLITAISATVSLLIIGPKIDWASSLEEAILSSGKVPGGQAAEIADKMSGAYKFFGYLIGIAGPVIAYLFFALYLWIVVNLCKRPISIAKCFAIYAWTDLVNLPKIIMLGVLGLGTEQITSFKQLAGLSLGSPLCYIPNLDSISFAAFGLLSKFDLFTFIHLIYIAFAVAALTGMKRPMALLLSFLPWIISFLFALGSFLLHSPH